MAFKNIYFQKKYWMVRQVFRFSLLSLNYEIIILRETAFLQILTNLQGINRFLINIFFIFASNHYLYGFQNLSGKQFDAN